MKIFTKESLINEIKNISKQGWIENKRHGNVGGIGNTLEDLLGIEENNLPLPNANEWELKAQRLTTSSLTTLFHMEPSPRAMAFVPNVFLKHYGWKHKEAGKKYSDDEKSFRQTINAQSYTERGFLIRICRQEEKVFIVFDKNMVAAKHKHWLNEIEHSAAISNDSMSNLTPYWGFNDLKYKVGSKLLNCFYIQAEVKKLNGKEFFRYSKLTMLQKFSFDNFITLLENGNILVDIDARTGHNHGTKFRLRQNFFSQLYEVSTVIDLLGA